MLFEILAIIFMLSVIGYLVYVIVKLIILYAQMPKLYKEADIQCKLLSDYGNYLEKNSVNDDDKNQLLKLCNDYLNMYPNNFVALNHRADLYASLGFYDLALEDYRYLMKAEPNNKVHAACCAKTYAALMNINMAFSVINNYYKSKSKDSIYYNALGYIYEKVKNYELAIKNYQKAINLSPDEEYYYEDLAQIYLIEDIYDINKYNEYKAMAERCKKSAFDR